MYIVDLHPCIVPPAAMSAKAIREFDGKQLLRDWFNKRAAQTPYAFAPFLQIAGDTTLESLQAQSTTTLSWLRCACVRVCVRAVKRPYACVCVCVCYNGAGRAS